MLVLTLLASGCTYELRQPGASVACGVLEFEINTHGEEVPEAATETIVSAVGEFGALVGRDVNYVGGTERTHEDQTVDHPVLIEIVWSDEAPDHLGYAEPLLVDQQYGSGWIHLNPEITTAPDWLIRRLVLHELGHLAGLLDVDDPGELMDPSLALNHFGPGDLTALILTHGPGCDGAQLAPALLEVLRLD